MFKKLKDKLAEEVKSSPQRIQQFAQAAQAAVTSASSSISDITNNDLFSIGGDETPQNSPGRPPVGATYQLNHFQDVSLSHTPSPHQSNRTEGAGDREDTPTNEDQSDTIGSLAGHRLRRLSNTSVASDVSFRLPSYESPSMYHLQSDMDVSASEAEEHGFRSPPPGALGLDRITKEQLYAAYRRTQERYSKYRTRYAELAKHYKNLERENTKARAVLVETQDKALRRISELREQCTLEQSAKAHLENALRVELDERSLKIEALNTKIKLLQSYNGDASTDEMNEAKSEVSDVAPPVQNLIDLTAEPPKSENSSSEASPTPEIAILNNKLQKMEQLVAKYKESHKTFKDKNSQLTTEIQIVSNELEKKRKENEQLQAAVKQLTEARQQVQELKETNHELQITISNYDKTKVEEISVIKTDLNKAHSVIQKLNEQIEVLTKREEENAISLAENKLSIHKELESKEAEIKMLKYNFTIANNEIKSYEIVNDELKQSVKRLDEEKAAVNEKLLEMESAKASVLGLELKVEELQKQGQNQEQRIAKITEEYKCLELQLKQESAEKLAMIDRNNYLENRNQQLTEDNSKKNKQIVDLEKELLQNSNKIDHEDEECERLREERDAILLESKTWQAKHDQLLKRDQEERVELVKLQSEIEKLLENHEKVRMENIELTTTLSELQAQVEAEREQKEIAEKQFQIVSEELHAKLRTVKYELCNASETMKTMEKEIHDKVMEEMQSQIMTVEATIKDSYDLKLATYMSNHEKCDSDIDTDINKLSENVEELKRQVATLSEEKYNLEKKAKRYEKSLETNSETNKQLNIKKEHLETKIKDLQGDVAELNNLKISLENVTTEKNELLVKVDTLDQENKSLKLKTDQIVQDISNLQSELTEVKDSHGYIEEEKNKLVLIINQMEQEELNKTETERTLYNDTLVKNEEIKKNIDKLKLEMESLIAEKNKVHNQLLESQYELKEKDSEIANYKGNNEEWEKKLASILEENNVIHEKCERLKQEKESFHEKIMILELRISEYEKKIKQQDESSIEKEFLDLRISQLENDLKLAKLEKDNLQEDNLNLQNEITGIKHSNTDKIQDLNYSVDKMNKEILTLRDEKSNIEKELNAEKVEKHQFITKLQELHKNFECEKITFDNTIAELKIANTSQSETITDLQNIIHKLKQEHLSIVQEVNVLKDRDNQHNQEQEALKSEKEQMNERIKEFMNIEKEYKHLRQECDKIKEDKTRLVSDIEGLQVHLTKVSKDNSQLNDRIREMIANDADSTNSSEKYKDDVTLKWVQENEQMRDTLKARQDQIEDLERQNSILVEEKLELEDQLKTQTDTKENVNNNVHDNTEKDLEMTRLKQKNIDLQEIKLQLESKLADLELLGRSGDSNVQQLEQKNEKLRLTNEKMERRLDEALVSLRHLRALEENTELEYLRNILYEYLTGSGTHSITLAKVLAAVVKFDDRQTQLVLQREKERQGLLSQLGLL